MFCPGSILAACDVVHLLAVAPGPDCEKVSVEAVLNVDGTDPRQTWGTELESGKIINVRPRPDLGWTVDPASPGRLLDPQGKIATFQGEIFRQACHLQRTRTFYVGPEDLPNPDRPPN
jgi:hypothetical protein